jgi:hypothetical protein
MIVALDLVYKSIVHNFQFEGTHSFSAVIKGATFALGYAVRSTRHVTQQLQCLRNPSRDSVLRYRAIFARGTAVQNSRRPRQRDASRLPLLLNEIDATQCTGLGRTPIDIPMLHEPGSPAKTFLRTTLSHV